MAAQAVPVAPALTDATERDQAGPAEPAEPESPDGPSTLRERLGADWSESAVLGQAMAHRSWCAETTGAESNERLEFLGDAVLGLVVTDHLYRTYPSLPEGQLAQVRSAVVNAGVLAEVAEQLQLGGELLLGKGEDASGGREKPSILADAMEAVIGAVYLDGGWEAARELIMGLLGGRMAEAAAGPGGHDYKTRLQELAARRFDQLPRYEVVGQGPDHAKLFGATVYLTGEPYGTGEGRSKKQAEQAAARVAWASLADAGGARGGQGDESGEPQERGVERVDPDDVDGA